MRDVYDERGVTIFIVTDRCVRTERLMNGLPEGRTAGVKILYLGADGPSGEENINPVFPDDVWRVRCLTSPWTHPEILENGKTMDVVRMDRDGNLWTDYWTLVGIKDRDLASRGILFRFEVPEITARKKGLMKIFVDNVLLDQRIVDTPGVQEIKLDIKKLTSPLSSYMRDAHRIQKKLLAEFVRVAEKYDISYYLFCGGLIGALRHGGPVPWDDDLDIALPAESFRKLMSIAEKEWNAEGGTSDFRLIGPGSYGRNVFLDYMTRLVCITDRTKADTFRRVRGISGMNLEGCLALDLYLLEEAPRSVFLHRMQCQAIRFLYALSMGHRAYFDPGEHGEEDKKSVAAAGMLTSIGRHIPLGLLMGLYKWVRSLGRSRRRGKKVWYQANGYHRCYEERFPEEWFGKSGDRKEMFDGISVRVPVSAEQILRKIYGAYKEYPYYMDRCPKHALPGIGQLPPAPDIRPETYRST